MAQPQRKTRQSRPAVRSRAQREKKQRETIRRLREEQAQQRQETQWSSGLPMWLRTLIAVGVVVLLLLVFFRVDHITVTGNVRYTQEEVADASGITLGDVLMGVNKTRAASRILVKLPYVQQVELAKVLPGTVEITLSECKAAMAATSEFDATWLMNQDGKLLEELDKNAEIAYPLIVGVALDLPNAGDSAVFVDETQGNAALEVLSQVRAAGLEGHIKTVDVTDVDHITLSYDERVEIQLGDLTDISYKIGYISGVMAKLEDSVRGTLDLSFESGTQAVFHPLSS